MEALADIEVVTPYTSHYQRTYEGKKRFLGQMYVFNLLNPFWKQFHLTPFISLLPLPKRCCGPQHWELSQQSSSAVPERDLVCNSCLKSKQTSREYPPVEQRQGCPEFWERASVDWLRVGIWALWMGLGLVYVPHLQFSQSQQLLLFGCKRKLSQGRNICRNGSKVQEKDGNGAAPSESAGLLLAALLVLPPPLQ